jgi:predicted Na+-dependent transporter
VREVVDAHKKLVRNLSTACLAAVPFSQIGAAKAGGSLDALTPRMLAVLGAAIIAALTLIRGANLIAFNCLGNRLAKEGEGTPKGIVRAVVLAASQKTLPISIAVLLQLSDVIGPGVGLATLPCVLAHFTQVIIDSLLVSRWQRLDTRAAAHAA